MRQKRVDTITPWKVDVCWETLCSWFSPRKRKSWRNFSKVFHSRTSTLLLELWKTRRGVRQLLVFSSLLNTSNLRCVFVVFCFSIMASVAGDTPSPSLGLINSGAKSKALTNKPIMNSQLFMPRIYKVFLLKIAMTKCFLFLFSRGKRIL